MNEWDFHGKGRLCDETMPKSGSEAESLRSLSVEAGRSRPWRSLRDGFQTGSQVAGPGARLRLYW